MTGKWKPGNWSVTDRMIAGEGWAVSTDHVFKNKSGGQWNEYVSQYIGDVPTAHLIAAAPDLYAALDGLLKVFVEDLWNGGYDKNDIAHHDSVKAARAALAKARGETP